MDIMDIMDIIDIIDIMDIMDTMAINAWMARALPFGPLLQQIGNDVAVGVV